MTRGDVGAASGMFTGALLQLGPIEVLVVVVAPAVLAEADECRLTVGAYQARFARPVVLMAQEVHGAPRFYGPERIIPLVAAMPFELVPWRQFHYRAPSWHLPVSTVPGRPAPRKTLELPVETRDSHPTFQLDTEDLLDAERWS